MTGNNMEDLENRVVRLEEKVKSELGDDGYDGQVWRVANSHAERLSRLDDMIWRDGDSITAQILKLRTELRTIAVCVSILIPVIMKAIDLWLDQP